MLEPPISERLAMLTYQQKDLAREARVDPKTISDIVNGRRVKGPHPHVMKEIVRAISEHEVKLRDYLCSIHGIPNGEG